MFPLVNGSDSVARALNCIRNLLHQSTGGTSSLPCEALVPVRWIYLRSRGIPTLPPRAACWSLSKELQRLQDTAQSGELGKFNDPSVKLSTAFAYDSVLGQYVRLFVCGLPDTIFYWGNCVWSKPPRSRDDRISAVIATSSEVGCTVHQLIHSLRQQPESLIEPLSYHAIQAASSPQFHFHTVDREGWVRFKTSNDFGFINDPTKLLALHRQEADELRVFYDQATNT